MFVLCISVYTTIADAAVVWQDDFSDPNLPGWTLYGYPNASSPVMIPGDFSSADGTLKVLDEDVNIAKHDSNIAVGTWIFDMYVPDGYDGAFYVEFLSNGTVPWAGATNNSMVSAGFYGDRFIVWRELGTSGSIIENNIMDTVPGWHHIKVNRTSDCFFEVCINETLRASFHYYGMTSSTYLQIYSNNATGCAIDNLVVSDGDSTTILIIAGIGIAVVLIVLVVVFVKRR